MMTMLEHCCCCCAIQLLGEAVKAKVHWPILRLAVKKKTLCRIKQSHALSRQYLASGHSENCCIQMTLSLHWKCCKHIKMLLLRQHKKQWITLHICKFIATTGCPNKFGIGWKQCSEAQKCLPAKRAPFKKRCIFAPKNCVLIVFLNRHCVVASKFRQTSSECCIPEVITFETTRRRFSNHFLINHPPFSHWLEQP